MGEWDESREGRGQGTLMFAQIKHTQHTDTDNTTKGTSKNCAENQPKTSLNRIESIACTDHTFSILVHTLATPNTLNTQTQTTP